MFQHKNGGAFALALMLGGGLLASESRAQSCAEPTASQFKTDTLAFNTAGDLYEGSSANNGESGSYGVVQIAVVPDGKVFIAKMCSGQIRVYNPSMGMKATTTLAGIVPTYCNNEDGLLGIVADRNFQTNKWLYVFVTSPTWPTAPADADTGRNHLLMRYTYDSSAAPGQQLKNPKVLLRVQRMIDSRAYHAAGGLDMGSDGVLVIGTGDDTSPHAGECSNNNSAPILWNNRGCDAQKSSSNTASLRGKLLRIIPKPFPDSETPVAGIGTTYDIPFGNLWEKINDPAFNPNWNPAVDSISKVRKEIFTMGHRNPYHPRYDAASGWVFTGEVGLDAGSPSTTRGPEGREEWNLATGPGFFGHPYCVANNLPWRKYTWPNTSWTTDTSYNCAAVQNLSPNNYGIVNLPPAKPAVLHYSNVNNNGDDSPRLGFNSETAVGGPMYRYDPNLNSSVKFPPQYEGRVFFFDWNENNKASFRMIKIKPDGTLDSGAAATPQFPGHTGLPVGQYIDMRFGPHDGAMYVLKNSRSSYNNFDEASLYRVSYTGPKDNSCYTKFTATVGPGSPTALRGSGHSIRKTLSPAFTVSGGVVTLPMGYRSVELFEISGRKVWSYTRAAAESPESVKLPAALAKGVLHARIAP